ncbi:uncharacterized protein L969DRAFT_90731 [Mixia osmundae IAM 14324]|uniref:methylcrotonoyl-CoA carboxylase n=1 Tax=Mixia osmundae (strain CBS 9802 / IAM 14324 / JCM 22182 / KY 12970) TaxID=764103 RepID=G7E1U5_MIXOS|nr:uncharacterized protein L969DRAFT_90731 [Mixia osmundae IAM 14324]KEI36751.1 hypothetical protein L969DRAFT_90731 [Mixia osmundae IAM 14324]GAA96805.1 hypothetical protein E5Q_03477 [Mixia osmundae IAM 14324]
MPLQWLPRRLSKPRLAWSARLISSTAQRSVSHEHHAAALVSKLDTSSAAFKSNKLSMDGLQNHLDDLYTNKIRLGGSQKAREKHTSKGKLLPRDRINRLLDPFSPFLELSPFAGHELYKDPLPAGGMISGIGTVSGTRCMILANDPTSKGGSYHPISVKKHLRAQAIAAENRLPCIYLVESGGAALPFQSQVFPDREHFGRIFYNQAQMSKAGIPQLSVVHGLSIAGGAYMPAMSDENIIVRDQGAIFLAGPALVKAATGEVVSSEELGGGLMHSTVSGVTDHLAESDEHALVLARQAVASFSYKPLPYESSRKPRPVEEPLYDITDCNGIVSADIRKPFDMLEIIARLVDGSKFHFFKKLYGETIITGFAHLHGYPVGIIANNGVLFSSAALKATQFIQLCEQRGIPLLFLVNVSGYMVGRDAEQGGIARDGAKMVKAVATTTVPKFTVIVGGSFGAGNYGCAGRAYDPRFLFMWPNAKISVMSGEALSEVMASVSSDPSQREKLKAQIEHEATALYSSARLWDDGIIRPDQTRSILGLALATAHESFDIKREHQSPGNFGVFRM